MRKNEGNVTYHTLPCGMRMVHVHTPGTATAISGVTVGTGSRDDDEGVHGMAHMVEHTIFKGTARRNAGHIINRMEVVGGELNAFTTKEETVVYSIYPAGNTARAMELLADLIQNSQFPKKELDKERQVVAEEIDSYLDSPADAVFDDFDDLLFAGSQLGHNILGSKTALDRIDSEACRAYVRKHYTCGNMVVFYSGPESAFRVLAVASARFNPPHGDGLAACRRIPEVMKPFELRRCIDSHQDHTVAGARLPGFFSADRHAYALITNILGGPGMNSLLNVALRERRGLVYSVDASCAWYTDCGAFTVYYGCDPADTALCTRLVRSTIERVADGSAISERALEKAKKQYLGQLVVASDNRENNALSIARSTLLAGRAATPSETTQRILEVDMPAIRRVAETLLPCSILTFGPSGDA
ncbi:MAG: insulinase family protein [Muribaculaceae bacterium]|nr:insulinase family protein [Muribaculaceae bacterium]